MWKPLQRTIKESGVSAPISENCENILAKVSLNMNEQSMSSFIAGIDINREKSINN